MSKRQDEETPASVLVIKERPVEMRRRLEAIFAKPDIVERICDQIANGGSLVAMARFWAVSHRKILNWIYKQPGGREAYDDALKQRLEFMREAVMSGLIAHNQTDIRDLFDENGESLNPSQIPDHIAQSIDSIKVTERYLENGDREVKREYKLVDKLKSGDMLLRTEGAYLDKVEHSGNVTLEDILAKSWEKKSD